MRQARGDGPLGRVERRKRVHGRAGDCRGYDRAGIHLDGEGFVDRRRREFGQDGDALTELVGGQRAVSLVHRLGEHVQQGPSPAAEGVERHADLPRDHVGREEPDAADVPRKTVGVLGEDPDGVGSVRAMDADRAAGADAVGMQEHHDLPHGPLALPVLHDARGAHASDARDVEQAVGLALDHVEHGRAKCLDQLPRQVGADALDEAGPEVALDPFWRVWWRDAQPGGLELLSVRAVVDPRARRVQVFADGDLRDVADDGGRVAPSAEPDPQDAEAALGLVIRHALDLTRQVLGAAFVAGQWQGRGRTPGTTLRAHGETDDGAAPAVRKRRDTGPRTRTTPRRRRCRCARP